MNINKAITYSLLAHVRNSGTLIKGPIDVFVPLVKRVLYILNSEEGVTKGDNISEIKVVFDKTYNIDIPLPVLQKILQQIANEANESQSNSFQLFKDNAYIIKNYVFTDFEEKIQKSQSEAKEIHRFFQKFCEVHQINLTDYSTIFDFIDKNKVCLSKYLSNKTQTNNKDFTIEARFIEFFKKIPYIYDFIKRIYLGSVLSSYLEYKTENLKANVELLLDTNFIVSLLDLNTPESTHTCNKLIEVGKNQGYTFKVLVDTLEETEGLLRYKANNFDSVFLQSKINPEDIYNACYRRNLKRSDLEKIIDNLEKALNEKEIFVIPETSKYRNIAKHSPEYTALKDFRNSDKAALHDATAIYYVREKRGKRISNFEKVNCWFVHNSNHPDNYAKEKDAIIANGYLPEKIKVDELLNILWLSNPAINKSIDDKDITEIGLSSLVAFTLNEGLPKSSIIRELDDNIQKYAENEISDQDILLVSTRIVNGQLRNIQELNSIANFDREQFVKRLKAEAEKQRKEEEAKQKQFADILKELQKQSQHLKDTEENISNDRQKLSEAELKWNDEQKKLIEELNREREERRKLENKLREDKRNQKIKNEIERWRRKSKIELALCLFFFVGYNVFVLYINEWNIVESAKFIKDNIIVSSIITLFSLIFSGIVITSLILKYRNYSNIEAFKRSIEIPEDMKEIK